MMKRRIFSFLPFLLALTSAFAKPVDLSIRFEQEPLQEGLAFKREGLAYGQQGGKPAWVARHRSLPVNEWARSFLLTVTDPSVQEGRKPILDGEIVYWHEANTAVEVLIDSKAGSRKVAQGWGNRAGWQTLRFHVDDAFLGARDHGNPPEQLQTDGFDLRINASAGDFYIAEIRLTAFEASEYVNFSKTLQPAGVISSVSQFSVDAGQAAKVVFSVRNDGAQAFEGVGETRLLDWQGKAVHQQSVPVRIEPGKTGSAEVAIPADLAPDVYLAMVQWRATGVSGSRAGPAFQHSFVVSRPGEIFIVMDDEPIARGIEVDRDKTSIGVIEQGLGNHPVWIAEGGSSELPWGRAMRFRVTDEKFQAGRQPAVDLDVIYRQTSNAPVQVILDAKAGPRQVAGGWGMNPGFQRIQRQIDDAFLGNRDGGEGELTLRGNDLRVNSYNEPLAIRAIRLRGYETSGKVDLSRLLRFDGIEGPRPILVFPRGSEESVRFNFRNISSQSVDLTYRFVLTDWDDKELSRAEGAVQAPGGGKIDVPYTFHTTGLPNGVYHLILEIAPAGDPQQVVFRYEANLGVSPVEALRRASPGEFLYGIDSGEVFSWDWFDFLGVDITRRFPIPMPNAGQVSSMLADYEKHGMTSMIEADPPGWNPDANVRKAQAEERANAAADVASRFKGRIKYWELGNEPDLTFFYAGPMTDYSEVHSIIARAIRNADPGAVVMNGGLCFAGEEGDRRAREFVKIVPGDTIDAWAFHAHGAGVEAERTAWNRMVDVAKSAGKDRMPNYIETESGVAAVTKAQQIVQASTVVQKMVFAQSVKMPLFIWFRMFITGGDWAYTTLKTPQEPRPAAIAFRNMVLNLRGLRHSQIVDLGTTDAEAHFFNSMDVRRNAVVLWCNRDTTLTVNLGIADNPGGVTNLRLVDLFGNAVPTRLFADGTASVTVTTQPVFLTWDNKSAKTAAKISVKESLITAPRRQQVFVGVPSPMTVTVRNPSDSPLELELKASGDASVKVTPPIASLTILANDHVSVPFNVQASASSSLQWPEEWTTFLDVNPDAVLLNGKTSIPKTLPGMSGEVSPRILLLRGNTLELQKAVQGPVRERRAAAAFAEVESPIDQTVRVGAAADWWFACALNGKEVYNTLERGNGGQQTLIAHTFDLPLQKGRNLIAFTVLSGSMGFKLVTGGPNELQAALRGAAEEQVVEFKLLRDGSEMARQVTSLAVLQPPVAMPENLWGKSAATVWWSRTPQFVWESIRLRNPNEPQPDSRLWYKGPADLSAAGWIGWSNQRLALVVRVGDDTHKVGSDKTGTGADRLEILAVDADGKLTSSSIVATSSGATIVPGESPLNVTRAEVQRDEAGQTLYLVEIDPGTLKAMNLRLHDSDDTPEKQTLTWLDGWPGASQAEPTFWFDLSGLRPKP